MCRWQNGRELRGTRTHDEYRERIEISPPFGSDCVGFSDRDSCLGTGSSFDRNFVWNHKPEFDNSYNFFDFDGSDDAYG